jgi:hypothetical protein
LITSSFHHPSPDFLRRSFEQNEKMLRHVFAKRLAEQSVDLSLPRFAFAVIFYSLGPGSIHRQTRLNQGCAAINRRIISALFVAGRQTVFPSSASGEGSNNGGGLVCLHRLLIAERLYLTGRDIRAVDKSNSLPGI